MKTRIARLILVILMLPTTVFADPAATVDFHVAPNGNDAWSGRSATIDAARGEGPLATLTAARDKIRLLKQRGPIGKPIRVLLRGGIYRIDEPIRFLPEDSGTREAPIVYAAWPGEKPIVSGGLPIAGWQKTDGPLWTTVIPAVEEGRWYFRQLFVDGGRRTPARTPNDDYFHTVGPGVDWQDKDAARRNVETKKSILCKPEDIAAIGNLDDDAVAVVYHSWTTSRHLVESLDADAALMRFTNPSEWPMGFFYSRSQRYFVEFARDGLDRPGEWHLDRATGVLAYYPLPGEDMTVVEAIAPGGTEELLRLEGNPSAGEFVEHLRFEGISFQHTDWKLARDETADGFGAAFMQTAAVHTLGARNCVFERCEIAHTGGYALWLNFGCKGNRVKQCHLHDLGAGGVRIGQCKISDVRVDGVRVEKTEGGLPREAELWASHNDVYNCFIHDGGKVFQAGIGVLVGRCSHNNIRHNEICDFDYSGVSVGWSWWDYPPSYAHHNLVEYNHIHHLGWGRLSDMGGVYTLGYAPGSKVRNNLIHDILAYGRRGWGLYPDEGSAEMVWENNIVYRTTDGGIHDHLGRDNVVRNNIFAFAATRGQLSRNPLEGVCSFILERNIVYDRSTPPMAGIWDRPGYKLDYNVYWNASGGEPVFPGERTFRQWQALGHDRNSIVADPRFYDAERFDFRLKADSPALKLGFKPIDAGEIGLVGPPKWVELPRNVRRPRMKLPGE